MRRIDTLVTIARERSKNLDFSVDSTTDITTQGIADRQFIEWANDAQDHLQAMLLANYPDEFIEKEILTITAGTDEYTLSDRIFVNNKIITVEWSQDGSAESYVPINRAGFRNRRTVQGYVDSYIRRGNKIIFVEIPNSSSSVARVTYYRELDDLDVRRAKVSGTPSGATISLLGAGGSSISTLEEYRVGQAEKICICSSTGTVLLRNGIISSYNASTDVLTLSANVSTYLVSGYALANLASQYVTLMPWSSTHSGLPDNCERYIRTYMQKRALTIDESGTSIEEDVELKQIESDIITSFAEADRDIKTFEIVDEDIMI